MPAPNAAALMPLFRTGARERLRRVAACARALESASGGEREEQLSAIGEAAHGLKGSALVLGLERVAACAGELEACAVVALGSQDGPEEISRLAALVEQLERACGELAGTPPAVETRPAEPARVRVLCIEDDRASAAFLSLAVGQATGGEVVVVRTAREGIEVARSKRPDLVLCDLHLPDLDGDQVVTLLQADAETADIPVVLMSAGIAEQVTARAQAAGAAAVLPKPIDLQRLRGMIEHFVEQQPA